MLRENLFRRIRRSKKSSRGLVDLKVLGEKGDRIPGLEPVPLARVYIHTREWNYTEAPERPSLAVLRHKTGGELGSKPASKFKLPNCPQGVGGSSAKGGVPGAAVRNQGPSGDVQKKKKQPILG